MQFKTEIEKSDTEEIFNSKYINWEFFKNSSILVTGATGLIGSQIVKTLLYANEFKNTNIKILALIRNKQKAIGIFSSNAIPNLKFIVQDINEPLKYSENVDYIIHTANTTSSKEMVDKPVETIDSIVTGTKNILEFAKIKNIKSLIYLSSMEVYGDISLTREEPLAEEDYGYINILKPRSSYPEGKRLAECMCSAYYNEYKVPVKIARLAQTIGAGVSYDDGRVFAEFARCIVEKRDIVLKTKGETVRSYIYITDAISAILSMLEKGVSGECYNVANMKTTCSIKEMAAMLCEEYKSSKLKFDIKEGLNYYLGTIKYELNTEKLNLLDWQAKIDLPQMFDRLIREFERKG